MAKQIETIIETTEHKIETSKEKIKKPRMSRLRKGLIALLGAATTYVGADISLSSYRQHSNEQALQSLLTNPNLKINPSLSYYVAGRPSYIRNFSRDSFISGIISKNLKVITNQLEFSALMQGTKKDPLTGEEPGKILFEDTQVIGEERISTRYSACDTTALFLLNHLLYQELTGDKTLAERQRGSIERAGKEYIINHLDDKNRFIEDPKFCDGKRFGTVQTYWKDGGMNPRSPDFPVIYPLAHVQNMAGLRAAAKLLDSEELASKAENMKNALPEMYDEEMGIFYFIIGKNGNVRCVTDDSLQSMFYLELGDFPREKLERIVQASEKLETPFGYRLLEPTYNLDDAYRIFPFAQAIIHMAGVKHSLQKMTKVSSRIFPYLVDTNAEYFHLNELDASKGYNLKQGDDPQLWTLAAKEYFEENIGFSRRIRPEHHLKSALAKAWDTAKEEVNLYRKFGFNPF